jgi:hypothetical protein
MFGQLLDYSSTRTQWHRQSPRRCELDCEGPSCAAGGPGHERNPS